MAPESRWTNKRDEATATSRPRRLLQLSLRTLFILVTLAAIWLGVVFKRVRDQRAAVVRIKELGGTVRYDYEWDPKRGPVADPLPHGSPWLRRMIGPEFFQDVTRFHLEGTAVTDADLRLIGQLHGITDLNLNFTKVSDAGLREIRGCNRLRYLGLSGTAVTSDGLRDLKELVELDTLVLEGTAVSDVHHLSRLPRLQTVNLDETQVTSADLFCLAGRQSLRGLYLSKTSVDDSAVEVLKSMVNLNELHLSGTRISGAGLEAIRDALPSCTLESDMIDLRAWPVAENEVSSPGWWDKIVARIESLDGERRVKSIDMSRSQFTDVHISKLLNLKHVDFIDLRWTEVTEDGIERLRRALPDCDVRH